MDKRAAIAEAFRQGDYALTPRGVLINRSVLATGRYHHSVNGQDLQVDDNLITAEGIAYILGVAMGSTEARISDWYLAVFSGNVTPAANWTAANFAAQASEIVSTTEGYSNATRPIWTPGAVAMGVMGNLTARAVFNIACTTSVNISGAAVLSSNTRGGTAGKLISATRFGTVRQVYAGDAFELGYEIELQDS